MDGSGHLVLQEEAVVFFNEQLKNARNGRVSDPDWGSYVRSGEHAIRGESGSVTSPNWREIRAAS